jgi:hypothetical protein
MRPRLPLFVFLILLASATVWGAYDPLLGTWRVNLETPLTRFSPGYPAPKSQTYTFEAAGADEIRFRSDTVEADGTLVHSEYTARLDGKDYPITGDPNRDTVAWTRAKPFITEGTGKKAGRPTNTFSMVIWGGGLLMTVTSTETRDGKVYENVAVYNKVLEEVR